MLRWLARATFSGIHTLSISLRRARRGQSRSLRIDRHRNRQVN
jgi:hypothetical protein